MIWIPEVVEEKAQKNAHYITDFQIRDEQDSWYCLGIAIPMSKELVLELELVLYTGFLVEWYWYWNCLHRL